MVHEVLLCIRLKCFHSHSSEKRGLCLMKSSNELLQNLPYFIYTKTQKWKKQLWVFASIKFHKFWSNSLELFIKYKPLYSEECSTICMMGRWGVSLNRKNPFTIFSKMFKCLTSVFFWHRLYCHERTVGYVFLSLEFTTILYFHIPYTSSFI